MKLECAGVFSPRPAPVRRVTTQETPVSFFFLESFEGRIFWEDSPGPLTPEHFGQLVVCWLANGDVVAKRPFPSETTPGRFDLLSFFGPTTPDVEVLRVAPVVQIVTKGEVERQARADAANANVVPFPRRVVADARRLGRALLPLSALSACLLVAMHAGPRDADGDGIVNHHDMVFARGIFDG